MWTARVLSKNSLEKAQNWTSILTAHVQMVGNFIPYYIFFLHSSQSLIPISAKNHTGRLLTFRHYREDSTDKSSTATYKIIPLLKFAHWLTRSLVQTHSEPRHSSPAPAWTTLASAWDHPSFPCLQRRNLVRLRQNTTQSLQAQMAKQQWGKMCKESRARCCQSTPKPGPFSLPRAHKRVEVISKRILLSLESDFHYYFLLSDFLVIACFFLTFTAESPHFCMSLFLSLEELYSSSCQLLKCMLIRNRFNCHSTSHFLQLHILNLLFYW